MFFCCSQLKKNVGNSWAVGLKDRWEQLWFILEISHKVYVSFFTKIKKKIPHAEIHLFPSLSTGPPSPPENPISTVNETCVTLEWSPPRDTGGRGDITYSIHCRKCSGDGKKYAPCGSGVHFVPRQFGFSSATVLITDLQPDSNYSFTIESQNGVSDLSPTPRGTVVINVTTSQTGEKLQAYWNKG